MWTRCRPGVTEWLLLLLLVAGVPAGAASPSDGPCPCPPQMSERLRAPELVVAPRGSVQRIELADGSVLYGQIVAVDADRVTFQPSVGGLLQIDRTQILSVKRLAGRVVDGRFRPETISPTRLFFAPTARPLRAGEASFGVYEVLLPFLQVGITDWFSMGGGTQLFFGADVTRLVWVTPKVTLYSRGATNLGAGVIHLFGLDEGTGIAYGVGTFGPPEGAVTVGVGYAYAGRSQAAVLMLGGEKALTRRVRFITENWIWKGGYGFMSGGFRFQGEHLSADVGLGLPIGGGQSFAFPLVNFSYRF